MCRSWRYLAPFVAMLVMPGCDDGKPAVVNPTDGGVFDARAADPRAPTITIIAPSEGQAVHGTVAIEFMVEPKNAENPVDFATVMAEIQPGGTAVDITASLMGTAGHYIGTIQADDPSVFNPRLEGQVTLHVTAATTTGAVGDVEQLFVVDNQAPLIAIVSPEEGGLVGGIITVTANISDPFGVDVDNVVAVFGNGGETLASFSLVSSGGSSFTGTYDSRNLRDAVEALHGSCGVECPLTSSCGTGDPCLQLVNPTLTISAPDLAGNVGEFGYQVTMDYTAPVGSLDTPRLRESKITGGVIECSLEFDPLGKDANKDGQSVQQLSEFRARVEDRSNFGLSLTGVVIPMAGVDDITGVQLYILDSTTEGMGVGDALVVDTDGNGICDDINPALTTMSTEVVVIDLHAVAPAGQSVFGADLGGYAGYPSCNAPTSSPAATPPLCGASSGLQRVIKSEIDSEPVIFGIPPFDMGSCLGPAFDYIANSIADGWACVALRVEDRLGNVSVSQPIRICFNNSGAVVGCPPLPTNYPPPGTSDANYVEINPNYNSIDPGIDCSGTYNPVTMITNDTTDCIPAPEFPANQIRNSL